MTETKCPKCDEMNGTLDLVDRVTAKLAKLWQVETSNTECLPDLSRLISWLIESRETHKTEALLLRNAIKGEQRLANNARELADRMDINNDALYDMYTQTVEECDILASENYHLRSDIKDLLAALPAHVARCPECDRFKINLNECEHCGFVKEAAM